MKTLSLIVLLTIQFFASCANFCVRKISRLWFRPPQAQTGQAGRIVATVLPMILIGFASDDPPEKLPTEWETWWMLGVLLSPLPAASFILFLVGSRHTWPGQPKWHRPEMTSNLFTLSTMYDDDVRWCPNLAFRGLGHLRYRNRLTHPSDPTPILASYVVGSGPVSQRLELYR